MGIFLQENWVNATDGMGIGESAVYKSRFDTPGKAFHALVRECGRCVGKIRVDGNDAHVGWVFQKRQKYADSDEAFLLETWVTVHKPKHDNYRYREL